MTILVFKLRVDPKAVTLIVCFFIKRDLTNTKNQQNLAPRDLVPKAGHTRLKRFKLQAVPQEKRFILRFYESISDHAKEN